MPHKRKTPGAGLVFLTVMALGACDTLPADRLPLPDPRAWTSSPPPALQTVNAGSLKEWWRRFNDISLNKLIAAGMVNSPDRRAAEARILEARGNRRAVRGILFPQILGTANAGSQDSGLSSGTDNFYEAGFDASYEIDLFGKNRNQADAAESLVGASEASYQDVTLSLVAEITRNYIEYRGFEKQVRIARKNLEAQEKTLELVQRQKEFGEAPQLDVERAQGLASATRAGIPEFQRQADNARLRLTVLTGLLPEDVTPLLAGEPVIPGADVAPVLAAPADVLSLRPDIKAAAANLSAESDLAASVAAELFPSLNLSGFFGVQKTALVESTNIWSVALGAAVTLLDFGRIQGRIDAAQAREIQAYEALRKTVLGAVTDVETTLTDYARINEREASLHQSLANARKSLDLSQLLYKEGETSFLDVLDAQRTVNDADAAVVTAETAKAEALVALYKSLGVI